jgi:amino acid permease
MFFAFLFINSNEGVTVEANEKEELPLTTVIVVLSAIVILLICILITFYVLYSHIFPKQIYFVQQKGENVEPTWERTI